MEFHTDEQFYGSCEARLSRFAKIQLLQVTAPGADPSGTDFVNIIAADRAEAKPVLTVKSGDIGDVQ